MLDRRTGSRTPATTLANSLRGCSEEMGLELVGVRVNEAGAAGSAAATTTATVSPCSVDPGAKWLAGASRQGAQSLFVLAEDGLRSYRWEDRGVTRTSNAPITGRACPTVLPQGVRDALEYESGRPAWLVMSDRDPAELFALAHGGLLLAGVSTPEGMLSRGHPRCITAQEGAGSGVGALSDIKLAKSPEVARGLLGEGTSDGERSSSNLVCEGDGNVPNVLADAVFYGLAWNGAQDRNDAGSVWVGADQTGGSTGSDEGEPKFRGGILALRVSFDAAGTPTTAAAGHALAAARWEAEGRDEARLHRGLVAASESTVAFVDLASTSPIPEAGGLPPSADLSEIRLLDTRGGVATEVAHTRLEVEGPVRALAVGRDHLLAFSPVEETPSAESRDSGVARARLSLCRIPGRDDPNSLRRPCWQVFDRLVDEGEGEGDGDPQTENDIKESWAAQVFDDELALLKIGERVTVVATACGLPSE